MCEGRRRRLAQKYRGGGGSLLIRVDRPAGTRKGSQMAPEARSKKEKKEEKNECMFLRGGSRRNIDLLIRGDDAAAKRSGRLARHAT